MELHSSEGEISLHVSLVIIVHPTSKDVVETLHTYKS